MSTTSARDARRSAILLFAVTLAASACSSSPRSGSRTCSASAQCTAGGAGGMCVAAPSGSASLCAYPDASCPSGLRYGSTADPAIAGACVPGNAPDAGAPRDAAGMHPDLTTTPPDDLAVAVDLTSGSGDALGGIDASSPVDQSAPPVDQTAPFDATRAQGWTLEPKPANDIFEGIWDDAGGEGVGNVYAAGWSGDIAHSVAGSGTWAVQATFPSTMFRGVGGSGPNDVFAVGESNALYHTSDRGAHWLAVSGAPAGNNWRGVWGSPTGDVVIVGTRNVILHTRDGGATFDVASVAGYWSAVWGTPNGPVYALDENGQTAVSSDAGKSWSKLTTIPFGSSNWLGLWSSGNEVWASSGAGVLAHSTDSGQSWTQVVPPGVNGQILWQVWASPPQIFVAGLLMGKVLRSSDDGATWSLDATPSLSPMVGVWGRSATQVYVVGGNGAILYGP